MKSGKDIEVEYSADWSKIEDATLPPLMGTGASMNNCQVSNDSEGKPNDLLTYATFAEKRRKEKDRGVQFARGHEACQSTSNISVNP